MVEIVPVVSLAVDLMGNCRMARLVGCEMWREHLRVMGRDLEVVKMMLRGGEKDQLMEELEARVQGENGE